MAAVACRRLANRVPAQSNDVTGLCPASGPAGRYGGSRGAGSGAAGVGGSGGAAGRSLAGGTGRLRAALGLAGRAGGADAGGAATGVGRLTAGGLRRAAGAAVVEAARRGRGAAGAARQPAGGAAGRAGRRGGRRGWRPAAVRGAGGGAGPGGVPAARAAQPLPGGCARGAAGRGALLPAPVSFRGGSPGSAGGRLFLFVVLTGHEGTWRASFSFSASAVTACQTWKPSHSLGREFWSATRKTLFKIHFLRSLCLWTTTGSCAAHQAPDSEQEGLMLNSFCESLVCSEMTTTRMVD